MHSLTKFAIINPCTNITRLRRFDLGFWQSSKQVYREIWCRETFFGKFKGLSCFSRKMVLYSSTKFGIIKLWTNIPWIRSFDLVFSQNQKQIYWKLQYREYVFEKFQGFSRFSRTNCFVFVNQILHFWALYQCSVAWKLDIGFWQNSEREYRKFQYGQKFLEKIRFKVSVFLPEKGFCIPWLNFAFFSLHENLITQLIWVRTFRGSETYL